MDDDKKTYKSEEERLAALAFEKSAGDRFEKISNNYGELFSEVWKAQGLDYAKFQRSVFETVDTMDDNKDKPILDIGTGDGETITPFVAAGYRKLTGLDLNPEMLRASAKKFGDKVKLVEGDATDLSVYVPHEFPVIIAAACIHNIPKVARKKFWAEILRLEPEVVVLGEKIVDPDPEKHQATYDSEVKAIDRVYRQNHGLIEANNIWQDHYIYDENERLELSEIEEELGKEYEIKVVLEVGMYKTVLARKK